MKKLLFLLILVPQISFASGEFKQQMDTWTGHSIDEIYDKVGPASESFENRKGNIVYVYNEVYEKRIPIMNIPTGSYTNYYGNSSQTFSGPTVQIGGNSYTYFCRVYFETDEDKIIIGNRFEGNNCVVSK